MPASNEGKILSAAPPLWRRMDTYLDRLFRCIEVILGLIFIGAVLLNFATAFDRYVFGHSILGSDEIQIYVMIWMTFVGAAVVSWRHQHLRMDVIAVCLPRSVQLALRLIEIVLITSLSALLAHQSFQYVSQIWLIDRRSDTLEMPMWMPHSALAVGFSLISLVALWRLLEFFFLESKPESHPTETGF